MKTIPALILSLTALVSTSAFSADSVVRIFERMLQDQRLDFDAIRAPTLAVDPVKAGLELSFRRMLEDQRVAFDERRTRVMSVEQYYGRESQEAWPSPRLIAASRQ